MPIYEIKLDKMTFRELVIYYSIYTSKKMSDILATVKAQPSPKVFYESYLELGGCNMVSILAIDSKSI